MSQVPDEQRRQTDILRTILAVTDRIGQVREEMARLRILYAGISLPAHAAKLPVSSDRIDELDAAQASLENFARGFAADCYILGRSHGGEE